MRKNINDVYTYVIYVYIRMWYVSHSINNPTRNAWNTEINLGIERHETERETQKWNTQHYNMLIPYNIFVSKTIIEANLFTIVQSTADRIPTVSDFCCNL